MLSTHRDVMDEMIQIKDDIYTYDAEKKLKDWVEINPDDKYALFTLGLLNKKTEYLDYAKHYYDRVLEVDPGFAPAINNLGNISFILHDYNRAKELYTEAITIDPDLAASHYNLYKINILELNIRDIDVADEYFNKAIALAPDRVSYFVDTEIKGDYGEGISLPLINRRVMDEDISDHTLWGEILKSSASKDLAYDFWYDMMKGTNLKSAPIIGILALAILFGVGSLSKRYPFSKACRFCGKSFLLKSLTHMEKRDACNRCFAVYIRREGVDPKTKADLRMKVERINTIRKVILVVANLVIPGSGNIYRGKTKKGFLFLVLFTLFLIKMFTLNGLVVYPIKSMGFPLIHSPYLFGIILAVVYFFAQQDFLKSEVFKT
jgi:TM2 domain-containing membrane protein YozV